MLLKSSPNKDIPLWKGVLIFLVFLYCFFVFGVTLFQRSFIFNVDTTFKRPEELGFENIKLVQIPTHDGELLNAWFQPPLNHDLKRRKFILFFHGNGLSLASNAVIINNIMKFGDGILAIDYRGYGGSTGTSDHINFYEDAETTILWLKKQDINIENVIVVSYSLGTALGARIAQTENIAGAIFIAPFSSIKDIAQNYLPFVPVGLLLQQDMEPMKDIAQAKSSVFVIHGVNDWIIPEKFGKKFYSLAAEPKQMISIQHEGHGLPFHYDFLKLPQLQEYLKKISSYE